MNKKHGPYSVGIYCRLSKDDIGVGDSSSILSQKSMLEKFVNENGWLVFDFYIDDGYSGTNYDRPGFQRMIDDVDAGKINMIVVKDLSRLGRNYILTGQYTDIYFPDSGVRFIALNDGIDTINMDNDITPFKNILNEMYSKDISKKVRSAVQNKKQKGAYLSNYAPYGYMKDPDDKNKLIIEENSAQTVRRIYEMCASGMGSRAIAKTLNREDILSPGNYRAQLCKSGHKPEKNVWHSETIIHILRSRIYIGDMVQGVYQCARFKRTPTKRKPQEEWWITPGTHEPVVDAEIWRQVQTLIDARHRPTHTGEIQLFSGFLKCEDCGHALSYATCQGIPQYTCGHYRRHGKSACSCHYIRKDTLVQAVLGDIQRNAKLAIEDEEGLAEQLSNLNGIEEEKRIQLLDADMKQSATRRMEIDRIIKRLYEDSVTGKITDNRFKILSAEYEAEQSGLEKQMEAGQSELEQMRQNKRDSSTWLKLIKEYTDIRELDRIVLSELVDKITVGECRKVGDEKHIDITIYYRFVGVIGKVSAN
jgi:DNA invertase Pin-like site-specific DNA recombinase